MNSASASCLPSSNWPSNVLLAADLTMSAAAWEEDHYSLHYFIGLQITVDDETRSLYQVDLHCHR